MSLDENISRLIKRIYRASGNCAEWDAIAWEVIKKVGGRGALTTLVDLTDRKFDAYRFYGPETSHVALGIEEYQHTYTQDPSLAWGACHPYARFCDSADTIAADEYLQHPFVKWSQSRFGATHWHVGYTPPEERLSYSFSVLFPAEQGRGTPASLRLFRMLFDHMECAVWLGRRPFNPESDAAYLLLDSGGNVRHLSRGAERLLRGNADLRIVEHRLTPACAPERDQIELALAAVAASGATGTASTAVKLSRAAGQRPMLLTIKPLISDAGPFGKVHCELLVHIHDGKRQMGSLHLLQELFDLTDRELEVLGLLAEGHSLETLGSCLRISTNTVRAHLRSIFLKTGTSRQSELLQLTAEIAAV